MKKQSKNVVAKSPGKSLTTSNPFDPGKRSPAGLENVTAQDLIIPRLTILQALSPQLQKKKPEYIAKARAGMFCDTATGEVWDTITVVPCFFARVYLEWAPRESGKGLIKNHGLDSSILAQGEIDDKRRVVLPNGNYIAETAQYFCLNMSAKGRRSFIPMGSTQLQASRKWMMKITTEKLQRADGSEFTPPIYYRSWNATVAEQSNPSGDWFGWIMEPGETIIELDKTKELLKEAQDFYRQSSMGLVKGDLSHEEEQGSGEGGAM